MEDRFDPRHQMVGDHGLGDPIGNRRNPQHPNSATGLRDRHGPHRRREVAARAEAIPDLVQVARKILPELGQTDLIHPGCTLVPPNLPEGVPHLLFGNIKRLPW
jgi:hypothetical protein